MLTTHFHLPFLARKGFEEIPQLELSDKNETDFMYKEIFEEQTYWSHGITCMKGMQSSMWALTSASSRSLWATCVKNAVNYAFEPIPPILTYYASILLSMA